MGSHFVSVYSVDETRLRAVLGSGDRKVLRAWLRAIRKEAERLPEDEIEAREEAARQLLVGDVAAGEHPDGHHFGYAFLALCGAWADLQAVIECYVTKSFPALWALAAQARPNPFGVPSSSHGVGHVGWHGPKDVPVLRQALAAARMVEPTLARLGGTAENLAALDGVLAHAEVSGRGVVVSWAV